MNSKDFPEFELLFEHNCPVAALIQTVAPFTSNQIKMVYSLLPANAFNHLALANRWNCDIVACSPDWASEQLRRVPMTRPRENSFKITIE